MQQLSLFAVIVAIAVLLAPVQSSTCVGVPPGISGEPLSWEFGIQDSIDGMSSVYKSSMGYGWYSDFDQSVNSDLGMHKQFFYYWINGVILQGAKNGTTADYVPTANFTCLSDYSGIWGPSYPNAFYSDRDIRAKYYNLEVYVHSSAPNQLPETETSYIRSIVFVKNIGSTPERVRTNGDWNTNPHFAADISPVSNKGRYLAMWPWLEGDLGSNGDNPSATFNVFTPMALHIRGPNSRDRVNTNYDMSHSVISPVHYTKLAAGQEMALMFISSFGTNISVLLKNAAEIDTEPTHIFHDLNADQLSLIRNWGACQSVLAPDVDVTVTPPTQCSSGLTSDFTVSATTQRTDFTSGFTHRVILLAGQQLVAAQSSNALAVPNNAGTVKHQLWYKDCLIKETPFKTCDRVPLPPTATPVASPTAQSAPAASPNNGKTSDASSTTLNIAVISVVAVLSSVLKSKSMVYSLVIVCAMSLLFGANAQTTCQNIDATTYDNPIFWEFGTNDGNGAASFSTYLNAIWITEYALYVGMGNFYNSHTYSINGIPLVGGKNYTRSDTSNPFVQTASFACDSDYSGLWGPAYPDYRFIDQYLRGQYQNLEVYIHYSAPGNTSYIRSVLFIKNVGSAPERVNLYGDWSITDYANDISPIDNNGRYFTMFPWQEGDLGDNGDDPAASYTSTISSAHVAGPNAREDDNSMLSPEMDNYMMGITNYATLDAGQEMALMYITSFGRDRAVALKNAAEIDTEPKHIFHNLNADQLSLIRNWGACQSVLAPEVDVTVTPPTQCSTGLTSDFTVSATTQRTDFTSGFTHRVVSAVNDAEVVPAQSGVTLSVLNDIGPVMHQLWYKECLIKQTSFNSCTTASN